MKPDIIIKNVNIFGAEGATAAAIKDGSIIKVGKDEEVLSAAEASGKDDDTKIIDGCGHSLLPAFVDAHLHPSMSVSVISGVKLYDIHREDGESREDYIARVMAAVKDYHDNENERSVLIGNGWMPAAFTTDPEGLPTRHDLDKVCPDIPAVLRSFDGHAMLVNTKALEAAGFDRNTQEPRGGSFGREADGSLDGNLSEFGAMEMLFQNLPGADFTVEEQEKGILWFQENIALPHGITSVFDALPRDNAIKAYENLDRRGELKMHVSGSLVADPLKDESQFDNMIEEFGKHDVGDHFQIKTIKFFMDAGAFGCMTYEPFEKEFLQANGLPEDYCGEALWTSEELNRVFLKLSKAGYQIHVHCMGDGAVKHTLDAFEYVDSQGVKGVRNVITHIMNIRDEDVLRMKKLDVIAAMQPSWPVIDDFIMYGVLPMFGKKRSYEQYPIGRLFKAGILVTGSTDYPVVQNIDPFLGIQIGATRTMPKSNPEYERYKGIISGMDDDPTRDCMTLHDMIDTYTKNGSYQLFTEDKLSAVEEGKEADLLLLDKNIDDVDIMDVENLKIEKMFVHGKLI